MSEQGPHISRDVSERRIPVLNSDSLTVAVSDDESVEDLQLSGLRLIQKKKAFRFGMDSVLLAHFKSRLCLFDAKNYNYLPVFHL